MMLYGGAGFYLGIDLPRAPPDHKMHLPLRHGLGSTWDTVELLSAAGTFLAAVAAVVSVVQHRSGRDGARGDGPPDFRFAGGSAPPCRLPPDHRANAVGKLPPPDSAKEKVAAAAGQPKGIGNFART